MNIDGQGRLCLDELRYVEVADPPLLQAGDILFNNTNSPIWVGKTTSIPRGDEYTFSNHMTRVRLNQQAGVAGFIAFQLHHLQQQGYFQARCRHHVNQASISSEYLSNWVELLVAPVPEQHRIVAAIEQQFTRLDAGVASLRRVRVALKRYRAAVLKAAVEGKLTETWRAEHPNVEPASTLLARILAERRARWEADLRAKGKDPSQVQYEEPAGPDATGLPEVPEGWCWATPDQLASADEYALAIGPFGSNLKVDDYREEGVPLVFVRNIRSGTFDGPDAHYVSTAKAEELRPHKVKGGDILITKMGDPPGDACLYPDALPPAIITADCIKWTLSPLLAQHTYFVTAINSHLLRTQIIGITKGVAQLKVSLGRFKGIAVPLPPVAEKEQISAEVEQRLSVVSELQATVEANLKRAERLRQSILQRAFSGRLVPQDPNDEPASALLERIRADRAAAANGRTPRGGSGQRPIGMPARDLAPAASPSRPPISAQQSRLWTEDGK